MYLSYIIFGIYLVIRTINININITITDTFAIYSFFDWLKFLITLKRLGYFSALYYCSLSLPISYVY